MDLYHIHPETTEFTGVTAARQNPLEAPGVFLHPANTTEVGPPAPAGVDEIEVWDGAAWQIDDDFRGQTEYEDATDNSQLVSYIGPINAGWSLTPPAAPAPPTPAQLVADLFEGNEGAKALLVALDDGSLVPGAGIGLAAVKAIIESKV